MTFRGQTLHPISTIFNRRPQGTMACMLMENEDPALKNVGATVFTDRHTETQTHTQTDMTNYMIVAHPQMGNYKTSRSSDRI